MFRVGRLTAVLLVSYLKIKFTYQNVLFLTALARFTINTVFQHFQEISETNDRAVLAGISF